MASPVADPALALDFTSVSDLLSDLELEGFLDSDFEVVLEESLGSEGESLLEPLLP